MVDLAATGESVWAVGDGAEVAIRTEGWSPDASAPALPVRVDAAVSGSAAGLWLPTAVASLADRDLGPPADIPAGDALLRFGDAVETVVGFSGPATVAPEDGGLAVRFRERTGVTVGVRADGDGPPTVTVPPTPEGLATAVSQFPSALRTTDPRRSHPAFREHPPMVEFGDEAVPGAVRAATPETGIEVLVPRCLEHLFVIAPLSYYLGATVRLLGAGARPRLCAPAAGFDRELPRLPELQDAVAALLRRVVFLDCRFRDIESHPPGRSGDRSPTGSGPPTEAASGEAGTPVAADGAATPAIGDSTDPAPLDPSMGDLPPDERLAAYAAVPPEAVRPHLPEWHLSTSVAPRVEHARALPYLLDRLSLVYIPEATKLEESDLLDRAIEDFYRGDTSAMAVLAPDQGAGRIHGWLAEGTPVEAFKATASAHENRLGSRTDEGLTAVVVLNDADMSEERVVADIYRDGVAELPVEVEVHESLGRREFADLFGQPHDFVHYVGHCEDEGLECPDGYLAADDLERVRTRAFFLNACRSFHEGLGLVEGGAVAGGVTVSGVLNAQAVTVGTAFARLLIHGFGIERALGLARRRIVMGTDYAVVGDGTFAPAPLYGDPALLRVAGSGDSFRVAYEVFCSRSSGRRYRDPFREHSRLYGTTARTKMDREALAAFLADRSLPVVFDGDLRWARDLAGSLQ